MFGDAAYSQAPLTLDHDSVLMLLDGMRIGMAGPRTAIGDAIGLAVKLMEGTHAPEKVLVLLTDGNDTASAIPPNQAAAIAKRHGIVVHTIGIGDPGTQGEEKVDLDALAQIAQITGGVAFRALGSPRSCMRPSTERHPRKSGAKCIGRSASSTGCRWGAVLLLTLYHVAAYLIALMRAPKRVPKPVPLNEPGEA